MRYKLANISRVRPYLTEDKAKLITDSLVISTITYMSVLYLRLPSNQKKIQKLLNSAARLVLKAEPRAHIVDLLNELYWLNCQNMYEYQLICVLRRMRNGWMRAPITWKEIFYTMSYSYFRLRSTHLRVCWRRITSHGRNSFAVMSVNAFNNYELNSRWFATEDEFKSAIKFKIFSTRPNVNL